MRRMKLPERAAVSGRVVGVETAQSKQAVTHATKS